MTERATVEPGLPQAILVSPGDGGIGLARRLAARGVAVSVLVPEGQAWIARTRAAEGRVLGNLPEARESWLEAIAGLASRGHGVLISGSDQATEFLVADRERIPAELRSFESPASAHMELMDKETLYRLADRAGVRYPVALPLSSREEIEEVRAATRYPCLLKPSLSHRWRRAFGGERVRLVRDPRDFAAEAQRGLDAGLELLVNEYIPGPDTNLENAVLIRRADGTLALAYGLRKLRQYPSGSGGGSLHESADVPATMELATRLLDAADFEGLAIVEAKKHAETGEMVLIDVNVRLPQHLGLGDSMGIDASWRLYATLAGLPLPPQPPARPGVRNVVPSMEARAAWTFLAEGGSLRELLAGYRGVRDLGGLSLRDPAPLATLGLSYLKAARRRLASRSRPDPGD